MLKDLTERWGYVALFLKLFCSDEHNVLFAVNHIM
jgi:hypothetical protein